MRAVTTRLFMIGNSDVLSSMLATIHMFSMIDEKSSYKIATSIRGQLLSSMECRIDLAS